MEVRGGVRVTLGRARVRVMVRDALGWVRLGRKTLKKSK